MIAVVLGMVRARWAQAVTVFLLSVVATAAAVAGPVALRVVDNAVVRNEVADSATFERSVEMLSATNPSDASGAGAFDSFVSLVTLPGFHNVFAGELRAFGPVPTGSSRLRGSTSRVVVRDDLCQHVVIVAGRCLAGPFDVLVGADSAHRQGLAVGQRVDVQAEVADRTGQLVPDGAVGTLTVAGIYQPRDVSEAYWAGQYYFPTRADGTRDEATFVNAQTFDLIDHKSAASTVDSFAPAGAFAPDQVDRLEAAVNNLIDATQGGDNGFTLTTGIPDLIDRIHRGQALAHELVPVAFLPLVGLSWFVVFLAVGYGLDGRRHELGLVNLRGVRTVRRWWLALGETLTVIVLGAPVGYLVGYLVVGLVARLRLGGADGAALTAAELPYAGVALVGALAVAVAGQRRALREPVVDLLRGAARLRGVWRSTVVEIALVLLAVLGVVQLRNAVSGLTGVALLVPGLVIVAVTVLAARVFVPLAAAVAGVALRRGYLGTGLAAVQIARRPGSQRLFALLAVAVGLLAFVAAGGSVAAQARDQRAGVTVGAARVLTVSRDSAPRLLFATHQVDPAGTWAMAAQQLTQPNPDDSPVLAVDSGRLGAVADWRSTFGQSAQTLATKLQPPAGEALVLHGDDYTVDIDRDTPFSGLIDTDGDGVGDAAPPDTPRVVQLVFRFESLTTGSPVMSTVEVQVGRHTYPAQTAGCAGGCRLTGFSATLNGIPVAFTLYGMRTVAGDVIPAAVLAKQSRWRGIGGAGVSVVPGGGLRFQLGSDQFGSGDLFVSTVDEPLPVPVVITDDIDDLRTISGVDGRSVPVKPAASVAMLPRLGTNGVLVDLGYLDRVGLASTGGDSGQVWLSATAPADAVERLRKAGLSILDSSSTAQTQAALDRAGPALALRFHAAAAVLGIGLALGGLWLVAAVDRRRRAEDLQALRRQGLRPRFVRRAALWGYLWLVSGAAVAGLLAAGVAWTATGDHLPVLTDSVAALPPPTWPVPSAVLIPWALASAAMVVVAFGVAAVLRRTVRSARNVKG